MKISKVGADGLTYEWEFLARADGGVTLRRKIGRGNSLEQVFTEKEFVEIMRDVEAQRDELLDGRSGLDAEELGLPPHATITDLHVARHEKALDVAKAVAAAAIADAAAARALADKETAEADAVAAALAKEKAEAEAAEVAAKDAAAKSAAAQADVEKIAAEVAADAKAAANTAADAEEPLDAADLADLEQQVARQARLAEAGQGPKPDPSAEGTSAWLLAKHRASAETTAVVDTPAPPKE